MRLSTITRVTLSLALTAGGIVAACHNDVPGPTLPQPVAPEVTRESPKPAPIDPSRPSRERSADAGVAPTTDPSASFFGHAPRGHRDGTLRVAEAPDDAGVSDVLDLPPVVDSDIEIYLDSGTTPK